MWISKTLWSELHTELRALRHQLDIKQQMLDQCERLLARRDETFGEAVQKVAGAAAEVQVWQKEVEAARAERGREVLKAQLLAQQLATSQANVDWLRVQFNTMSNDRAAIAAAKGLALPAPQVEGQLRAAAEFIARQVEIDKRKGESGPQTVGTPEDEGAGIARTIAEEDDLDRALDKYAGAAGGFDDVGDEEARRQGIGHDTEGNVVYNRS